MVEAVKGVTLCCTSTDRCAISVSHERLVMYTTCSDNERPAAALSPSGLLRSSRINTTLRRLPPLVSLLLLLLLLLLRL